MPIDGTVNDPYPFKVLIGPDNLTANGIDIPRRGRRRGQPGTASGDWTLSCVRGQNPARSPSSSTTARSAPCRRTATGAAAQSGNTNGNNSTTQGGLGWISDPYGIPASRRAAQQRPAISWARRR